MRHFSLLPVLLLAACATSPLGRHQLMLVSNSQLENDAAAAFKEMQKKTPPTSDARTSAYVTCVADAITGAIPSLGLAARVPSKWQVVTFNDDKTVNAFAMPGGKIGVYTGLLKVATSQEQLAAVLGHEVSHVLAGHSAERYSEQMAASLGGAVVQASTGVSSDVIGMAANAFILLPFSRTHETEADLLGLDLMASAGFDPAQAVVLWQNMAKASGGKAPPELLSTHPSDETRMDNLRKRLKHSQPLFEKARAAGHQPQCGSPS